MASPGASWTHLGLLGTAPAKGFNHAFIYGETVYEERAGALGALAI